MAASPRSDALAWVAALGLFLALDAAADAANPELLFSRHSEAVARRSLSWMREAVAPETLRVHEPYETRELSFEAMRFPELLDAVYGPSWREEEEILFTCSDGYQPTLPVERVLAHRPWLAFARADQPEFSIEKHESGKLARIALEPFYLVWENLEDATIRQESDYGWPYQLVGVDLIRTRDRFPKMTPPPGSAPEVMAGFAAFRIHCSKCHPVNGEGGTIGPELNAATSPVEVRDPAWLREWIEAPDRVRPGTRMPPLNPALPDRAATVERILAYLGAMARVKDVKSGPSTGP